MGRLKTLPPRIQTLPDRIKTDGSWRTGKTTDERGYNYRWKLARADFLRRNPLCCYCDRKEHVTAATVVDHRIPHRGDERLFWDETNWQPMCKPCHDKVKRAEELQGHG